jgi:hypothetical protein
MKKARGQCRQAERIGMAKKGSHREHAQQRQQAQRETSTQKSTKKSKNNLVLLPPLANTKESNDNKPRRPRQAPKFQTHHALLKSKGKKKGPIDAIIREAR